MDGARADVVSYLYDGTSVAVALRIAGAKPTGAGRDSPANIENVVGTHGAEWLRGDGGPNLLLAYGGSDLLEGRGGEDVLDGGADADSLDVRDGGPDLADRGPAADTASVDLRGLDTLFNCETVLFPRRTAPAAWGPTPTTAGPARRTAPPAGPARRSPIAWRPPPREGEGRPGSLPGARKGHAPGGRPGDDVSLLAVRARHRHVHDQAPHQRAHGERQLLAQTCSNPRRPMRSLRARRLVPRACRRRRERDAVLGAPRCQAPEARTLPRAARRRRRGRKQIPPGDGQLHRPESKTARTRPLMRGHAVCRDAGSDRLAGGRRDSAARRAAGRPPRRRPRPRHLPGRARRAPVCLRLIGSM